MHARERGWEEAIRIDIRESPMYQAVVTRLPSVETGKP